MGRDNSFLEKHEGVSSYTMGWLPWYFCSRIKGLKVVKGTQSASAEDEAVSPLKGHFTEMCRLFRQNGKGLEVVII